MTNFSLQDEQMVKRLGKMDWAAVFHFLFDIFRRASDFSDILI
jgi:hypothetical protein